VIFGLFELLLIAGVGWVVVRMFSQLNKPGPDQRQLGQQNHQALPRDSWTGAPPQRSQTVDVHTRTDDPRFNAQAPAAQQPPPKLTREQKMNELKRQYVADEITVEQYEAELDKLMRE
jgi:hypothetical protein